MNRNDIDRLLVEAWRLTKHEDFVIIGSLSIEATDCDNDRGHGCGK